MPTISWFYGIAIQMYFVDHPPPHFKATGRVIDGKLPRQAARLVRTWTALHRTELMANWELARQHGMLERIAGLDAHQGH